MQNLGTVGGNISHAEPNGDSAPALISLGASVLAASHRGERTIPLDDFFRGPFENCLEPDEMVARVRVPLPVDGASSVYVKHVQRAVDRATVGIGVQLTDRRGRRLRRCSNRGGRRRTVAVSGHQSRGCPKGRKDFGRADGCRRSGSLVDVRSLVGQPRAGGIQAKNGGRVREESDPRAARAERELNVNAGD